MALRFVQGTDSAGKGEPQLIKNLSCYQWVHLQVFGAATVRIADNQRDLLVAATGGQVQGLQLKQEDGIKSLKWRGQLWIISSSGVFVEIYIV